MVLTHLLIRVTSHESQAAKDKSRVANSDGRVITARHAATAAFTTFTMPKSSTCPRFSVSSHSIYAGTRRPTELASQINCAIVYDKLSAGIKTPKHNPRQSADYTVILSPRTPIKQNERSATNPLTHPLIYDGKKFPLAPLMAPALASTLAPPTAPPSASLTEP